jgi:hypothetical protein
MLTSLASEQAELQSNDCVSAGQRQNGGAWEDLNLRLHPDPKINGEQARGSVRAEPGSDRRGAGCPVRARSSGGLEGDLVAEGLQLADVVALGAFGTDTGVVEAGAEVLEVGLWVG